MVLLLLKSYEEAFASIPVPMAFRKASFAVHRRRNSWFCISPEGRLESALSTGVIVVETSINSGTMHTVNFTIKQNKLLACYVPDEKYKYKNSLEGNFQLLKNKKVYPLHNIKALNEFVLMIEEKMKFENVNDAKEEYYQMTFMI